MKPWVVGDIGRRFRARFTLDGATWDLTNATVTLYLQKPDGSLLTKTATVSDPTGGVAEYVTISGDLSVAGNWSATWKVADGVSPQLKEPEKLFQVVEAPGP